MGDISVNFNRSEFACKCGCGFDTVDVKLIQILEIVRKRFNKPIIISSGCRCEKHNASVGGEDGSKHKIGIAADIVVKDTSPADVYSFLCEHAPNKYGIGNYNSFTHIDVRNDKKRF